MVVTLAINFQPAEHCELLTIFHRQDITNIFFREMNRPSQDVAYCCSRNY